MKRRDIPLCLLLVLTIVLIVLTLSQIAVVHHTKQFGLRASRKDAQKQSQVDNFKIEKLLVPNVPSMELNRKILLNEINAARIADILQQAALPSRARITVTTTAKSTERAESQSFDLDTNITISDLNVTTIKNVLSPRLESDKLNESAFCPSVPPYLTGKVFVDVKHSHNLTVDQVITQNPDVEPGGIGRPQNCSARHRIAVIIPYRDRHEHLVTLLSHLHPILMRQQLDYRIYVVEQYGNLTFNKGSIMNIAFTEALKQYHFHCFIFHDVDLIPEDDRNMYSCPENPRHMSVAVDEMGYKLQYQDLVGGVLVMKTEHFFLVNGYSNMYWGWGAEDDDIAYRMRHVGLKITRPPESVARYKMIPHVKRKPVEWRKRGKLLYTGIKRYRIDGLNSLRYSVVSCKLERLYTHLLVDVGAPPPGF